MRQSSRGAGRLWAAAALTAPVLTALSGPASAHGVANTGGTVRSFVWSGYLQMLSGWDHMLFVTGVVLLAGTVRRAAHLISLFALGHSTTLFAATLAGFRFNPTVLDVVITLSLVFVGVVGLVGRPKDWRWFGACVLGFGLVHGLGLSTRLQARRPPPVHRRLATRADPAGLSESLIRGAISRPPV